MSRRVCVKIAIFAFSVVLLLAYGSLSTANAGLTPEQARELGAIQKAIKTKGAKWKAGETSVSKLSREERKGLCGLRLSERPKMETGSEVTLAEYTATVHDSSFDWRNYEVVTGVKNQASCGSCWAFAAVGAMESALLINENTSGIDLDLSEQFVVSCDDENYGCCGGYMYRVYDFLTNSGTIDESCFPYNLSGTCKCNRIFCINSTSPCDNMCADWESSHKRISGWDPVSYNVDAIKSALLDGPVPCGMDVYDDFFDYTDGIYEHVTGDRIGGHAVVIVGWEDPWEDSYSEYPGCWIVKNSWGTGWGEAGFFRIKWGDSNIGMDAAILYYEPQPCIDNDEDGYTDKTYGGDDCDDTDSTIHPGAEEVCDGVDNNCDGTIDEGCPCPDNDGDGHADEACGGTDCDDTDPIINPGETEVCGDGVDNNCNGINDEGCPTCLPKGEPCVDNSDCCSGKCLGRPDKKKCK